VSDKNFDPAMKDTCELKEAWADGKKLYYVEDIPGLLEQITCLNKQLAKANEVISECWRLVGNDVDSKSTLPEHVNALNERIEELQDALVDDAKAKAMLNKLAMENGELNIKASGNIFHVFCETFVETFKDSGATNYLVAEFNSEELGAFTVTMQRSEGLTVYQKLNEANERVEHLEQCISVYHSGIVDMFPHPSVTDGTFFVPIEKYNSMVIKLAELGSKQDQVPANNHSVCELECGAYGTYCKCQDEQLRKEQE